MELGGDGETLIASRGQGYAPSMIHRSPWAPLGLFVLSALVCVVPEVVLAEGPSPESEPWAGGRGRAAVPSAPEPPADSALLVLAASSLTDVLPRVAALWLEDGGVPTTFSFGATSRLAPQVVEGAPGDLFFSADGIWMDWVAERGGILEDTRTDLLGNELVVVVRREDAGEVTGPRELAGPVVRHLALAGENAPAGRYGRAALEAMGIWESVASRVVRAGNVRGALEWVALGEAEAGIVYRTDAQAEDRVTVAFSFPAGTHPEIRYAAAVLTGAPDSDLARAFLDYCRTPRAANVFRRAGFLLLPASVPGPAGPGDVGGRPPGAPNPWSAIRLSLIVALASMLAGFVPAVALGWLLARRDFLGKSVVATVILAPLVMPPVVTGFILLSLLGTHAPLGAWLARIGLPVPFTLLGATLAALTVGLPLYVVSVRNAFQTVDPMYEEVAWTLGHRPWPAFRKITFPLALPGIAAGAVLAFARALGEFGATVVLAGNVEGDTRTIALAVYTLLESPQGREAIWVLVGASVVTSLLALLGFEILSRHQRRQIGGRRGR